MSNSFNPDSPCLTLTRLHPEFLPVTAFSWEGSTFSMIKTMPIDFRDYFRSKRNFSLRICSLGSVLYIVILGIVCTALGILKTENSWVILAGAAVCWLCDLIYINWLLLNLKDSGKPYFTWDTETEISRKLCWIYIVAIVVGIIGITGFVISTFLLGDGTADVGRDSAAAIYGSSAAFIIALFVISLVFSRAAAPQVPGTFTVTLRNHYNIIADVLLFCKTDVHVGICVEFCEVDTGTQAGEYLRDVPGYCGCRVIFSDRRGFSQIL